MSQKQLRFNKTIGSNGVVSIPLSLNVRSDDLPKLLSNFGRCRGAFNSLALRARVCPQFSLHVVEVGRPRSGLRYLTTATA
jgi:hypothetical protein